MNAEGLIGTVLGSCTLQKLVGQGGMGAVYLAQQSRPRRQVAVKVLLPMSPLNPNQLAAFLERFRRETDAAASLEHPHIMPVYEYGENDGLAYLVMPYISGGTLRDELERIGPLPLPKVVNYLEQIAAALDFAHSHGVIHRDIKPANIMVTTDERLLLTDFGLVKIISEGQIPHSNVRLTGAGTPVGTPDYMAPEQVIGEEIDIRADLYSLGVILYQMVTGTTPFQGETPMQIAAQHLQIPPPSPQMWRSELPISAEQVILRALAKRPADRFMHADDMATAFRSALLKSGIPLEESYTRSGLLMTASRIPTPTATKAQFGPPRQTVQLPENVKELSGYLPSIAQGATTLINAESNRSGGLLSRTGKFPMVGSTAIPITEFENNRSGGLLSRTGKFPMVGTGILPTITPPGSSPLAATSPFEQPRPSLKHITEALTNPGRSEVRNTTGALPVPAQPQAHNTMRLSEPVKVVKVPVAGQPGHFITGLLPIAPPKPVTNTKSRKRMLFGLLALIALLFFTSLGGFLWVHNHPGQPTKHVNPVKLSQAALKATSIAQANATAIAYNTILSDPLDHNIHSWPQTPASAFVFKNGAYHITDDQGKGRATVLSVSSLPSTLKYTLTMEEINGKDDSLTNSFGMIFRCSQHPRQGGGTPVTTFYSFEVVNIKGGDYQFWKYDDSNPNAPTPWTLIQDGKQPFGNEYHQGKGAQATNTISIFMDGSKFTVTVNTTTLGKTFQDSSFTTGTVGMLVNEQNTEVAFKNMVLTHK